ncbi:MAG TPA: tetraacyldisaccharide 4'-kinase, partial [Candidatus Deferrimicrobiaceae bacterium]
MTLGILARARRGLYGAGILARERLPRPVVSVGNLVLGGAGKTPHVQFLASWLSGTGRRVAVLSRGYGRRSRGVVWVNRGDGRVADAREGGDEPVLLARSLPDVPVVVAESRAEAGKEVLAREAVDVFLLDDGFQHLSLHRDVDLLLVDCARGLSNRLTLPLGPLREPPSHARFADGLVITKCPDPETGERTARTVPFPPGRPRGFSRLVPRGLVGRDGQPEASVAPGSEILAFSGIARNGPFRETLEEAGFRVARHMSFPDHHEYSRADLGRIAREAAGLPTVTTEKDMVRLPADVPFPVFALRVAVEFLSG